MEFSAKVTGLAAKDTSNGTRIELKLTSQFDTALFAQLGECFSDRVHVAVNHPQGSLDFDEEDGAETDEDLFEQKLDEYEAEGEEDDEELYKEELREEIERGKRNLPEDPAGEPGGQ